MDPNLAAAALFALGGAIGFTKKGSVPSLVAGLTSGGILTYFSHQASHGNAKFGHQGALVVTVAMALMMGNRAFRSGKFMPAGLVASIAALAAVWNAKSLA
eukprot:m.227893 g.227893  ORF g.227893 m.227893 type:complete len:101 (+) comp17353_c0_seq1:34-336(+)